MEVNTQNNRVIGGTLITLIIVRVKNGQNRLTLMKLSVVLFRKYEFGGKLVLNVIKIDILKHTRLYLSPNVKTGKCSDLFGDLPNIDKKS